MNTGTQLKPAARPHVKTRLMGVLRVFVARIPTFLGYRIADLAGDFGYRIAARSRRAAISNLRRAMHGSSRSQIREAAKGVFRSTMRNYYDLCRAPDLSEQELESRVIFDDAGWQRILDLQKEGKGVVMVGAHFGAFDMIGQALARRKANLTVLITQVKPAWLSDWITQLRFGRGPGTLIVGTEDDEEGRGLSMTALKEGMRHLRSGGILGVFVDRNMEQTGVTIPFFGEKTLVASGVAKMAMRTRSYIVTGLCRRLPNNRYGVEFGEPIMPTGAANNDEDLHALLTEIFKRLEHHIRRSPDQWVLLQPLWPAGSAEC